MKYNFDVIRADCERLYNVLKIDQIKSKKILITGANGIIGSFLADYFHFLNDKYGYDISLYLTSYSPKSKCKRIKHLVGDKKVKYFSWDASEQYNFEKYGVEFDYVFFCSGYAQPAKFTKESIKTTFINTVGVNSILKYLSSLDKQTHFAFMSTSEIYGDPDEKNIPTEEEYNGNYSLNNNRACYIVSKRLGEVICKHYIDTSKINIKILRISLLYGPGALEEDKRVLQDFIFKAVNEKKICLIDSGRTIRNYLYLTDGMEMILNLIFNSVSKGGAYNIGREDNPITILMLAEEIGKILDCNVEKNINDDNEISKNSPKNVCVSMKKYRNEFNKDKSSYINLHDGLTNVIKWFNYI